MLLSPEIIDAIRAAAGNDFGGQKILAEKAGISCANISRWINGRTRRIKAALWEKLQPHIHVESRLSPTDGGETEKRSVLPDSVQMVRVVYAINSASYLNQRQKQDLIGRMLVDQETVSTDKK